MTALVATLIMLALLLLGAVSAQAKPGDPPVDFLLGVNASSASFTPSADTPGAYELVLRGVPDEVDVTELTRAKTTASLPMSVFMLYWTAYGDETGQFETNPPRAVLQAADAAGNLQQIVVRLSDGSRRGSTLRFDAEIVTSENVQNVLDAKVDEVVETEPPGEPVLVTEPTTLADVELFVDMPKRIAQPEPESPRQTRTWMPNGGNCNGVFSSRLRNCWDNIPAFSSTTRLFVGGRGFAYDRVGEVDLGGYYWNPVAWPQGFESNRNFVFWAYGDFYGIHRSGIPFWTTERCTWFMARWLPGGSCW